jgi:hypothetical protein
MSEWMDKLKTEPEPEPEPKPAPKPKPSPKVRCPFCGELFTERGLSLHKNYCDQNPANEVEVEPYTSQEEMDIATALLNWIQGYRRHVIDHPNGKNALEMERMLRLYKKITGKKFIEGKYAKFDEWIKKNKIYGGDIR